MQFLSHPFVKKLAIAVAYAAAGAAIDVATDAGYLPPSVKSFLASHSLETILVALGLGHVLPEAGKRKPDAAK